MGRVERIEPDGGEWFRATVSYAEALASTHLSQLLNLAFGNASILPDVRIVGLELPPALLARYRGPAHGITGLRRLLGVYGRPLLATAIKSTRWTSPTSSRSRPTSCATRAPSLSDSSASWITSATGR